MKVQTKIKIERFKIGCKKLCLVFLGIVIGVSWYIAICEYQEVSWVSREEYVIYPASAEDGHTKTEYSAVEGEANGGQPATSLSIEEKIRITFPEEPEIMIAIAKCESRLDNSRIGDTHLPEPSYGIFQVNRFYNPKYSVETLSTVDGNIQSAREIYDEGGKMRWACYSQGYYKKHL